MRFESEKITNVDLKGLINDFSLFEPLSAEEKDRMVSISRILTLKKNRYIFKTKDQCKFLFFLIDGTVKIGTTSNDGKEVIKSVIHPRAMFGEESIFNEELHEDFAKVISNEVTVLRINMKAFREILESNIGLNVNIMMILGSKLKKTEQRLESLIFNDARTRIINFIKDNANNFGMKVGFEMLLKHSLTQQDIANYTGTSRQTVTSVLNDLRKTNQIYFKRKSILIRDMATLS
jgi:CRP-like cAMP-binding protein